MNRDPRHMIVLGAIRGDAKTFGKIAKISNVAPEELNAILEELEREGLIRVIEKKGLFGKKIQMQTTERGDRELESGIDEAQSKWGQMRALYETKDKKKLKGFMDDNRSFFPMMMFFGVMDMMMFSMMFSMIGSSMGSYVPAEDMPGGTEESGQDYSDPGIDDGGGGGGGFDFDMGF